MTYNTIAMEKTNDIKSCFPEIINKIYKSLVTLISTKRQDTN